MRTIERVARIARAIRLESSLFPDRRVWPLSPQLRKSKSPYERQRVERLRGAVHPQPFIPHEVTHLRAALFRNTAWKFRAATYRKAVLFRRPAFPCHPSFASGDTGVAINDESSRILSIRETSVYLWTAEINIKPDCFRYGWLRLITSAFTVT